MYEVPVFFVELDAVLVEVPVVCVVVEDYMPVGVDLRRR